MVIVKKINLEIEINRCKSCGFCINVCPKNILKLSGDLNSSGFHFVECKEPEKCIGCGACYTVCPDNVIKISVGD